MRNEMSAVEQTPVCPTSHNPSMMEEGRDKVQAPWASSDRPNTESSEREIVMSEILTQQNCSACTGDSPPVSEEEIQQLKPQIPDWRIEERNGELHLERVFTFPDFKQALAFTNQVGEQAEAEGHHPALLTEWGKVTVSWWTHAINGLHKNDFIMAAKTDQIASQF